MFDLSIYRYYRVQILHVSEVVLFLLRCKCQSMKRFEVRFVIKDHQYVKNFPLVDSLIEFKWDTLMSRPFQHSHNYFALVCIRNNRF